MQGVDMSDPTQVAVAMAGIRAELNSVDTKSMNDRQTAVALMTQAKKTFGSLVCTHSDSIACADFNFGI
jgi:hypothetical protein